MHTFKPSDESTEAIVKLLKQGKVVALPTETVYGLAADGKNPDAVREIYRIKQRPVNNPLILHVSSIESATQLVELNPLAEQLMSAFWPGSLTIVLPKKNAVPDLVTAGLPSVGVRMPNHPWMLQILTKLGRPLAAPSANPSNYISPTNVEHVRSALSNRLDYVLDGGQCTSGIESTIVSMVDPKNPILLRPGPITKSDLECTLGRPLLEKIENSAPKNRPVDSPGQFKKHYSPRTPLVIEEIASLDTADVAYLHFKRSSSRSDSNNHFYLSDKADLREAENNLYSLLHQIDQGDFKKIVVDPIPSGSEWNAIRDRLNRASNH